jgi:hypothetical protein
MKTAIIKNGYDLCRQILDQTRYDVSPLIQLAKKGESDWLEFKASLRPKGDVYQNNQKKGDFLWHVAKAVVAFANTYGGAVLLGVDDTGNPVGLQSSVKDSDSYNWDSFCLNHLKPALFPRNKKWICTKHSICLSKSLDEFAETRRGTLKGYDVAIIFVKPIYTVDEDVIAVTKSKENMKDHFWPVRIQGDLGDTRELRNYKEIQNFCEQRKQEEERFNGLWEHFIELATDRKNAVFGSIYDTINKNNQLREYLKEHVLGKPEISNAHALYVDMHSSKPISSEAEYLKEEYDDFDEKINEFGFHDDLASIQKQCTEGIKSIKNYPLFEKELISEEIIRKISNNYQQSLKYIIIGLSGSGKTTLLREIAYSLAELNLGITPVLLNLYNSSWLIVQHGIVRRISNHLGVDEGNTRDMLSRGEIILLLDGFNEIPQKDIKDICSHLGSLINDFQKLKIIITSRYKLDKALEGHESSFEERQLHPLNKQQCISLISRRIQKDNKEKQQQQKPIVGQSQDLWDQISATPIVGDSISPFYVEIIYEIVSLRMKERLESFGKIIRIFTKKVIERELIKDKILDRAQRLYKLIEIQQNIFLTSFDMLRQGKLLLKFHDIVKFNSKKRDSIEYCLKAALLEDFSDNDIPFLKFSHENIRDYFAAEYLREHPQEILNLINTWKSQYNEVNSKATDYYSYRKEKIGVVIMASELSNNVSTFLRSDHIMTLPPEWREVLLIETKIPSASKALAEYCALIGKEKNIYVRDTELNVRKAAAISLSAINAKESIAELIDLSKSKDFTTRLIATVALGKCKQHEDIANRLTELIFDPENRIASKALVSLCEQKKDLSNISKMLLKCYSYSLNRNMHLVSIKNAILERIENSSNDMLPYLRQLDESIYLELLKIKQNDNNSKNSIQDTVMNLISSLGPATDPPTLIGEKKEVYSGVLYNTPFPGVIKSESFSSDVPFLPLRKGGFECGKRVKFSVKSFYTERGPVPSGIKPICDFEVSAKNIKWVVNEIVE